jgi:hypothetical protein
MIGTVIEKCGPIRGHSVAPLNLKGRLSCLKNALADVPQLKGLRDRGGLLIVRFRELGIRRNDLVHGAAWHTGKDRFESLGFGEVAGKYVPKYKSFDVADAVSLNVEITKLIDDATAFLLDVEGAFR